MNKETTSRQMSCATGHLPHHKEKQYGHLLSSSTYLMTFSLLQFAADKRHNAIGHS